VVFILLPLRNCLYSLSFDHNTHTTLFFSLYFGCHRFALRDMSSKENRQTLGIMIFQMALNKWNYNLPPEDGLEFEDTLKQLKRDVNRERSQMFQKLVKDYLLENNHRVHLLLYPSDTLDAEMLEDEEKHIHLVHTYLSQTEFDDIKVQANHLHKFQTTNDSPEALSTIPTLNIFDRHILH